MSYLLDTNVISEIRKPSADKAVAGWLEGVDGEDLFLSVLVLGEISQGIERLRRRDGKRAQVFAAWLGTLKREYRDRLLPVTGEVAETWGRLNAVRPLPVIDGLLAATALVNNLTLVTQNVADVEGSGVAVLNPFTNTTS